MAPGIVGIGTTSYISAHNQILAHARAYRLYQEKYFSSQGGQVGITLNIHWAEPEDPSDPSHLGGAERDLGDSLKQVLFRGSRQGDTVCSGLVCRADPAEWRISQRYEGED